MFSKLIQPSIQTIKSDVLSSYSKLFSESEKLSDLVSEKLSNWKISTEHKLYSDYPYYDSENQLRIYSQNINQNKCNIEIFNQAVENYSNLCKSKNNTANLKFWHNETQKLLEGKYSSLTFQKELSINANLLKNKWQETIDKYKNEWCIKKINSLRNIFLKDLENLLKLFQQLHQQLKVLGFKPGILLDFSDSNFTLSDLEQFKRWSKYLSEDKEIRKLCNLLGKMRQLEFSKQIEKTTFTQTMKTQIPDNNSKEEIIGIRLGNDIEYALPSEIALLSNPETALLFDLKLIESRLMCFDMQGIQTINKEHISEQEIEIQEKQQGPMIICIDTSGSMSGQPETIAKAITLYLSSKAKEKKRPCYLINFSTRIQTLEFNSNIGMKDLIKFLKMSFNGGTDVTPAIQHALVMMKKENYQKADLLIISDFVMRTLPQDLLQEIELQKNNKNQFYSLVIGNIFNSNIHTIFDKEWIFNPNTSQIQELIQFTNNSLLSN